MYIVLYVCSLFLLKEDIGDKEREELSKTMIMTFIVIIGVEFIMIILENLRIIFTLFIEIFRKIKSYINKKKRLEKIKANEVRVLPYK